MAFSDAAIQTFDDLRIMNSELMTKHGVTSGQVCQDGSSEGSGSTSFFVSQAVASRFKGLLIVEINMCD